MAQYIVYLEGEPACDYSDFGCGHTLIELTATTALAAGTEVFNLLKNSFNGDQKVATATLYTVISQKTLPVPEWYGLIGEAQQEEASVKAAQQEQELYRTLHAKYGK